MTTKMSDSNVPPNDRQHCASDHVSAENTFFPVTNDYDSSSWTLQIKTVGEQQADFSVKLNPEDDIAELYDQVAIITGLPREQQRLIYRGRLLPNISGPPSTTPGSSSEEASSPKKSATISSQHFNQKVKDIVGLTNGHSIHLVRKHEQSSSRRVDASAVETPLSTGAFDTSTPSTSETATSSLLGALLGAGVSSERNNRRNFHRLREEDWIRPDPGSMESVRQGLMTVHTLHSTQGYNRRFFRGQWIDCKDTVNQWLEATVVAIMYPQDILRSYSAAPVLMSSTDVPVQPSIDTPVAVTDLDGRRRLLLEPCTEAQSEEQIDGVYYKRRDSNACVQLLHVHYNGWPVRWDEWIHSDSERIRPFRTRTRHTSHQHASPTIDSVMPDPPSTYFTNANDESADRHALLSELHRVFGSIQTRLEAAMTANPSTHEATHSNHLPWQDSSREFQSTSSRVHRQRHLEALAPLLDRLGRILTDAAPQVLALSESVGREDQDEGTEERNNEDVSDHGTIEEQQHPSTLGGLLSLLSRDRRGRHGSVASSNAAVPSVSDVSASLASSASGGNHDIPTSADDGEDYEEEDEVTTVDPDYRDFAYGVVNTTRGDTRNGPRGSINNSRSGSDEVSNLLGAYLAAMSLSGLTSIGTSDVQEGAVEGLGRLLRDRGGGSGGIDIHIHAVVTAPGLDGAIGLAALAGGRDGGGATFPAMASPIAENSLTNNTTTQTTGGLGNLFGGGSRDFSRRGSRRFRPTSSILTHLQPVNADDDAGIFADLYSETPQPINPNGLETTLPDSPFINLSQSDPLSENIENTPDASSRRSRSRSLSANRDNNVGGVSNDPNEHQRGSVTTQRNSSLLRRFFRRPENGNN